MGIVHQVSSDVANPKQTHLKGMELAKNHRLSLQGSFILAGKYRHLVCGIMVRGSTETSRVRDFRPLWRSLYGPL